MCTNHTETEHTAEQLIERISRLEEKIAIQQKELSSCMTGEQEAKDAYLHLASDFQNYKKRMEKEQGAWMQSAQAQVFMKLLTVVDNFDRAIAQQKDAQDREGFALIYKSFQKLLGDCGVKEMADYTLFNPEHHEAVLQVDAPEKESGVIVAVLERGYLFNDIVLRVAKVSVAK